MLQVLVVVYEFCWCKLIRTVWFCKLDEEPFSIQTCLLLGCSVLIIIHCNFRFPKPKRSPKGSIIVQYILLFDPNGIYVN